MESANAEWPARACWRCASPPGRPDSETLLQPSSTWVQPSPSATQAPAQASLARRQPPSLNSLFSPRNCMNFFSEINRRVWSTTRFRVPSACWTSLGDLMADCAEAGTANAVQSSAAAHNDFDAGASETSNTQRRASGRGQNNYFYRRPLARSIHPGGPFIGLQGGARSRFTTLLASCYRLVALFFYIAIVSENRWPQ
jgi:hypothetical protein